MAFSEESKHSKEIFVDANPPSKIKSVNYINAEPEKIKEIFLFRVITPEMEMSLEMHLSKEEKELLRNASITANKGFELINVDPGEAIKLLLEAVDSFDQAGGYEAEVNGDLLNDIGLAYSWVHMYSEALNHFNMVLKRFENKDWERYVSVLINRASLYEENNELTKALEDLNYAYQIAKKHNFIRYQLLVLNNSAHILYSIQEFDHALEKYKQVLSLKSELNYTRLSIAQTYFNIATVYEDKPQIKEAINAYKNCLELLEFKSDIKRRDEAILLVAHIEAIRRLQDLIREHVSFLEGNI